MSTTGFWTTENKETTALNESMITCYYVNRSPQLEVLRIANIQGWYFEKTVFPQQRLTFEAPDQGLLEIYTSERGRAVLADRFVCKQLEITP